jgi:hypothetical protein
LRECAMLCVLRNDIAQCLRTAYTHSTAVTLQSVRFDFDLEQLINVLHSLACCVDTTTITTLLVSTNTVQQLLHACLGLHM